MDTVTSIDGITAGMIWTFLAVLVGLCGIVLTILSCAEKVQKFRQSKRQPRDKEYSSIMQMLTNDKCRLDAHEASLADIRREQLALREKTQAIEKGQRVVCAGVMALLEHELHNGNSDQMEEASADINRYLLDK